MKHLPSFCHYMNFDVIFKILFILSFLKLYMCDDKIIYPANFTFGFTFYEVVELQDDDVLFLAKDGVHVFSSNFSIDYSDRRDVYANHLGINFAKRVILSKFNDGHVISYINLYLNFFSPIGKRLANIELKNEITGFKDATNYYGDSFSLVAFSVIDNNYYYFSGYVYNNYLYLYYNQVNTETLSHTKLDNIIYHPKSTTGSETTILEKRHSCELMYNSTEKLLTCFFITGDPKALSHASFKISSSNTILTIDNNINFYEIENCGSVKSCTIKDNPNKALVCFCAKTELRCLMYDIVNNIFKDLGGSFNNCDSDSYFGNTIKYFSKTNEFLVGHLGNSGSNYFHFLKYSDNFTLIYNATKMIISDGSSYYPARVSFLYLTPYRNYSLMVAYETDDGTDKSQRFFEQATIDEGKEEIEEEEYEEQIKYIEEEEKMEIEEKEEFKQEIEEKEYEEKEENVEEEEKEEKREKEEFKQEIEEEECEEEIKYTEEEEKVEIKEKEEEYEEIEEEEYEEKEEEVEEEIKEVIEEEIKIERGICEKENYPFYYEDDYICYNEKNKPENLYLNSLNKTYNLCYEKCKTCNKAGDENLHNCDSCIDNYRLINDSKYHNNCYEKCNYYYYFSSYDQYKCTDNGQCPEEASLLIRNKKKCIDDCKKDIKLQYNSECYDICPNNTKLNKKKICEENEKECVSSDYMFGVNLKDMNVTNIELCAKNYADEFTYTNNHISQYSSSEKDFSFILYKNKECIEKLNLNYSTVDFGECYTKVQKFYNITQDLIVSILKTNINKGNKPITFYQFYSPITGKKLDIGEICNDTNITIYENILSNMNFSSDLISLALDQNINIFDLDDPFYNDLCFHFKGINGKDVPLKERILSFYPNIVLCDDSCTMKGVNISTLTAICDCKVNVNTDNYLINNEIVMSNEIVSNAVSLIKENNLAVMKCYKSLFVYEYFKVNVGGFIMLAFLIINLLCMIIFFVKDSDNIQKYIYKVTDSYLTFVNKNIKKDSVNNINEPPKRKTCIQKVNVFNFEERLPTIQTSQNLLSNAKFSSFKRLKNKKLSISKIQNYENFFDNPDNKKNNLKKKIPSEKAEGIRIQGKKIPMKIAPEKNTKFKNIQMKKIPDKIIQGNRILETVNIKGKINKEITHIEKKNITGSKLDIDFNDYLNPLDDSCYRESLQHDKRKFFESFVDSIKADQLICNTFFDQDNIMPKSVKIIYLTLTISFYLVINGFFYNENLISELYHSDSDGFFSFLNGSFERLTSVSIIVTVLTYVLSFSLCDEDELKAILTESKKTLKTKSNHFVAKVKKSYIIYLCVSIFLNVFFWFYVSCFNNVYPNTKYDWIKSSMFLFIFLELLSTFKLFLEAVIRYFSLKKKLKQLFEFSQILG